MAIASSSSTSSATVFARCPPAQEQATFPVAVAIPIISVSPTAFTFFADRIEGNPVSYYALVQGRRFPTSPLLLDWDGKRVGHGDGADVTVAGWVHRRVLLGAATVTAADSAVMSIDRKYIDCEMPPEVYLHGPGHASYDIGCWLNPVPTAAASKGGVDGLLSNIVFATELRCELFRWWFDNARTPKSPSMPDPWNQIPEELRDFVFLRRAADVTQDRLSMCMFHYGTRSDPLTSDAVMASTVSYWLRRFETWLIRARYHTCLRRHLIVQYQRADIHTVPLYDAHRLIRCLGGFPHLPATYTEEGHDPADSDPETRPLAGFICHGRPVTSSVLDELVDVQPWEDLGEKVGKHQVYLYKGFAVTLSWANVYGRVSALIRSHVDPFLATLFSDKSSVPQWRRRHAYSDTAHMSRHQRHQKLLGDDAARPVWRLWKWLREHKSMQLASVTRPLPRDLTFDRVVELMPPCMRKLHSTYVHYEERYDYIRYMLAAGVPMEALYKCMEPHYAKGNSRGRTSPRELLGEIKKLGDSKTAAKALHPVRSCGTLMSTGRCPMITSCDIEDIRVSVNKNRVYGRVKGQCGMACLKTGARLPRLQRDPLDLLHIIIEYEINNSGDSKATPAIRCPGAAAAAAVGGSSSSSSSSLSSLLHHKPLALMSPPPSFEAESSFDDLLSAIALPG